MEERRRFYRIDDSVVLNYRAFPENRIDEEISRLKLLGSQHQSLQTSLGGLELRLDFLLEEISEPLPEIAEALKIINRKISILSHLDNENTESALGLQPNKLSVETQEVNLSGSGLAFYSPAGFSREETMEIQFILLPEYYDIKAIGRVVSSRESGSLEQEKKFEVAVDFIYLNEKDQEFIVSHVLRRQGEELKEQRALEKVEVPSLEEHG
ncbi:MAG: PilZ domain-containing protein [Gammaproteobacteria bacterium]